MSSVLLATCARLPRGDEDAEALTSALASCGVRARWVAWDDPDVDWTASLVVLRSTWDYTMRREQFLAWSQTVPQLANPADVLAWNSDKRYLRDLAAAGVPVVPTAFVAPGEPASLPDVEFVVKPSVGAGSRGAGRFAPGDVDAAREHLAALHAAERTALVQPYLGAVDAAGESALVYVDGQFSHSARKGPMLAAGTVHGLVGEALFVPEAITARGPSDAELAVGAAALAAVRERFGTPLYARVDLLPTPDGPVVVELELVEPSLFLDTAETAAKTFATAIAARA